VTPLITPLPATDIALASFPVVVMTEYFNSQFVAEVVTEKAIPAIPAVVRFNPIILKPSVPELPKIV